MSIANVQSKGTQRSGSSSSALSLTFTSTTTSGNLLVVVITSIANVTPPTFTLSDTYSNGWLQAVRQHNGNQTVDIWYAQNCTGGASHQITVTPNQSAYISMAIAEYSGVLTTVALDKTNSGTGASNNPSSGSVTTTTDGELYIGALDVDSSAGGTPITEVGWTIVYNQAATSSLEGISMETLGDASSQAQGTYSATWTITGNVNWVAAIATFKPAAGTSNRLIQPPKVYVTPFKPALYE